MIQRPKKFPLSPLARPEWVDAQLLAETRQVWEPIYGRQLTEAELVEILVNVGRLIDAL